MTEKTYPTRRDYTQTATIAVGGNRSEAIDLKGMNLAGFLLPSNFDGTTLKLEMSDALDGTYIPVHASGVEVSYTVAASKYIAVDNLAVTAGLRYIKLVTGSNQTTTDTVIKLALRPV